jgi:hypothetical protein
VADETGKVILTMARGRNYPATRKPRMNLAERKPEAIP